MGKLKGIVSKISGDKCMIITKDGEFRRVPLPPGPVRVGQEIQVSSFEWSAFTKYALIAASLLIAVFGVTLFRLAAQATPVAYVSLDINPSLEIAVDKAAKVVDISAFNQDAKPLLNNLDYQEKDVYTVLSMLLQRAIELKYVAPDRPNLVVSSVVEVDPQNVLLDTARLQDAVASPLKGKPLKASVVVYKAKKQDREAARKVNLSTGKYLFYEDERKSGAKITLEEVKEQSLGTLVETKKAKLPEPKAEVIIQYLNRDTEDVPEKPIRNRGKNQDKAHNGKNDPDDPKEPDYVDEDDDRDGDDKHSRNDNRAGDSNKRPKDKQENQDGEEGRKQNKKKDSDDRRDRDKEKHRDDSNRQDNDRINPRDESDQKDKDRKKITDENDQKGKTGEKPTDNSDRKDSEKHLEKSTDENKDAGKESDNADRDDDKEEQD